MRMVHLVPGLDDAANGIAVAAKLIASVQGAEVVDCLCVEDLRIEDGDEVWVHSMWTPQVWRACRVALRKGARLVRMTHGCLDPLRVSYHGWKKSLVAPIERRLFARCDRVVVTGAWEEAWCREWGVQGAFETVDLKRFFTFPVGGESVPARQDVHLLYLGRRHPLKGLDVLEAAVREIDAGCRKKGKESRLELRAVSNAFGTEKEKLWEWCGVLVLPTLSENFGLVVAEALERGKRVITTDGAPAWNPNGEARTGGRSCAAANGVEIGTGCGGRLVYLNGYRAGTNAQRVALLRQAIEGL